MTEKLSLKSVFYLEDEYILEHLHSKTNSRTSESDDPSDSGGKDFHINVNNQFWRF